MSEVSSTKRNNVFVIIIGVLVIAGFGASVWLYSNNMNLQYQINTLQYEKESLENQINDLQNDKANLESQIISLEKNVTDLEYQIYFLQTKYDNVFGYLKSLSDDVQEFHDLYVDYCSIPEAFENTLNSRELNKIASTVTSVTQRIDDVWDAQERIYKYVVNNIEYVYDVEMPYISYLTTLTIDGREVITRFTTSTLQNYVQTPEKTLEYEQGDCEDQAILTYAMTKYYEREILGTEYRLYLARIRFSDGTYHLAVFVPVQGGNLCILDPAGHYYTSKWNQITQREALTELQRYSNEWLSANGISVSQIELYDVDVDYGSYTLDASGNINTIANFLS